MTSRILEQYTNQELDEIFCRDVADIPYEETEHVDIDSRSIYTYPPPSFCHPYIGNLQQYMDKCERYELRKIGKLFTISLYESGNVYAHTDENVGKAIVIALLKKEYNIA